MTVGYREPEVEIPFGKEIEPQWESDTPAWTFTVAMHWSFYQCHVERRTNAEME